MTEKTYDLAELNRETGIGGYGEDVERDIPQIDINIQQVDLVHDFAPFSNRFLWNNDRVASCGIAAGEIDIVACTDSSDNQGIDPHGNMIFLKFGSLESKSIKFGDNRFIL